MSDRTADDLPVVAPPFDGGRGGDGADGESRDVWGVVLAAGTSSRFGDANKLLATVDGRPLVRHATATLSEVLDVVVVVVGHEAGRVGGAVADLDVRVEENDDYERGQATSVRRGALAAGAGGAEAAVFALGDMPSVEPSSVDLLVAAYQAGAGDPLAAAVDGRRGNPVLFSARHFDALVAVDGDAGGREVLLGSDDAALVETGDPGVLRDVDVPSDLESVEG